MSVGHYRGRVVIGGYHAEADLVATQQRANDQPDTTTADTINWHGSAILLEEHLFDLLEFDGTVEVIIRDRIGHATVIDATPGSGTIYLLGEHNPPFDLDID